MVISYLSKFCVNVDETCDYIPIVSTLTNLIDIFQKKVFLPAAKNPSFEKDYYYMHMQQKSWLRCVILTIPIIGNIIIAIYDFVKKGQIVGIYDDYDFMLEAVRNDGCTLRYGSDRIKNDKKIALEAINQSISAAQYISEQLKQDQDIALKAINIEYTSFANLGNDLKNNFDFMIKAIEVNTCMLKYASERLRDNENFMHQALKQISDNDDKIRDEYLKKPNQYRFTSIDIEFKGLSYASKRLLNSETFIFKAIQNICESDSRIKKEYNDPINAENLKTHSTQYKSVYEYNFKGLEFASQRLRDNEYFVNKIVKIKGLELEFASPRLQNHLITAELAINNTGDALQFTSYRLKCDHAFVWKVCERDGLALRHASTSLRSDRDIVMRAMRQNWKSHIYVTKKLREDIAEETFLNMDFLRKYSTWDVLNSLAPTLSFKCYD